VIRDNVIEQLGLMAAWAGGLRECRACGKFSPRGDEVHQYEDCTGTRYERCSHPLCCGRRAHSPDSAAKE
jgi:hypothetical protein